MEAVLRQDGVEYLQWKGNAMPDSHKGLPEIITAFERGGQFFGVVSISIAGRQEEI